MYSTSVRWALFSLGASASVVLLIVVATSAAFWVAILIHEAGHALAARLVGFRIDEFRVGRWALLRGGYGWKLRYAEKVSYSGFVVAKPKHLRGLRWRYAAFVLGGSAANLFALPLALPVFAHPTPWPAAGLLWVATHGWAIWVSMIARGALPTDKDSLQSLLRRDHEGDAYLAVLACGAECYDGVESLGIPWLADYLRLETTHQEDERLAIAERLHQRDGDLPPTARGFVRAELAYMLAKRCRDVERAKILVVGEFVPAVEVCRLRAGATIAFVECRYADMLDDLERMTAVLSDLPSPDPGIEHWHGIAKRVAARRLAG